MSIIWCTRLSLRPMVVLCVFPPATTGTIPNQRDVHILKIDSTGYYSPITATEEVVEQPRQVLVYPNPVKDKLHFVFGLYSDLTISIYDASGREMISDMYHRSPTLDLTGFKKGLYLYRITGAKGLIEEGKIIKE